MTRVTVRPRTPEDELPAHLVPYWGRSTVDPRRDVNYCPRQSRKTPSIPWHNGWPGPLPIVRQAHRHSHTGRHPMRGPVTRRSDPATTGAMHPERWRRTLDGHREYGRIDWQVRRRVYRVTVYGPVRTLSEHPTYAAAAAALQAYVQEVTAR